MRSTEKDYSVPNIRDELRYVVRHDLMQNTARDTITVRNNPSQEALPMRRLGSFLPGGNPFEAPRAREYPLPPLTAILASEMFTAAAKNAGYHPFPRASANASRAYTNPDGSKFGACQYCGYCQRFGCEANAKG